MLLEGALPKNMLGSQNLKLHSRDGKGYHTREPPDGDGDVKFAKAIINTHIMKT